jgi:hypothetical protein
MNVKKVDHPVNSSDDQIHICSFISVFFIKKTCFNKNNCIIFKKMDNLFNPLNFSLAAHIIYG